MTVARPPFVLALLASAGAMLWLPGATLPFAILAWTAVLAAAIPRNWRTRWGVLGCFAGAAALAVVAWLVAGGPTTEQPVPRAWEEDYARLWQDLDTAADGALESLRPAFDPQDVPELFDRLRAELTGLAPETTLLLLDPNGEAVAWAGRGLLHEGGDGLPTEGRAFRGSQTAVTVFAIRPLDDTARRPWRLVAGRSLDTDRMPFDGREGEPVPWYLETVGAGGTAPSPVPASRATASQATASLDTVSQASISVPGAPDLVLDPWPPPHPGVGAPWIDGLRQGLWWLLALGMAMPAALEGRRLRVPGATGLGGTAWQIAAWRVILLVAASAVGFHGLPTSTLGTVMLAVGGLAVGLLGWAGGRGTPRGGPVATACLGGIGILGLTAGAAWMQGRWGRVDLAASFGGDASTLVLRLAVCVLGLAALLLAARRPLPGIPGDRTVVAATLLLLVAAAAHDTLWLSLPLLVAAGGLAAVWAAGTDTLRRPGARAVFAVVGCLLSATAWEIAHREMFRRELENHYLPQLAPPTADELNALLIELEDYFSDPSVGELLPELPTAMAASNPGQDLAFVLWRNSPLAHRDGLSTLVMEPLRGQAASFAFGIALDADLEVIPDPSRWSVPATPAWQGAMLFGETPLWRGGEPWGKARYTFLPRPGFRLGVSEVDELEQALVRGAAHRRNADGLPRPALFGLYDGSGRSISSPWVEAPPLPEDFVASEDHRALLPTPDGRCWVFKREGDEGIEALFLPYLEAPVGLERAGIHALAALWPVAGIAFVVWVLGLPPGGVPRLFERLSSSYSQRLLMVYTALLLVPLIALNLVLLRGFEKRLRDEELANAHAAVDSVRIFLIDYLRGLDPGFGIDTQVNRTLLEWLSSVVRHQVNLYWGSQVYASSQQELFTAGLLPRRIPGDIYHRLVHGGYAIDLRVQRHEESTYLELYAPLQLSGAGPGQQGLFISVPLLEQEEEVARELAAFSRRAVLVTTALFLLLMVVGSRLTQSFTRPIMALIEGTRRIASGATVVGVSPRERELSSLAEAIDDMAGRIAEGRRRLVQEKQVVERIIENITSAVVSLDREGRVLLHNQPAEERLRIEVGRDIRQTLADDEGLRGVVEFLDGDRAVLRQTTLRRSDEGEERDWTLLWVPLPGNDDPAALLVVDDATEVLRAQRLEAWAEMARIIAHEIKNPLTPIRLSTEHMQQVYHADPEAFDRVFERCTDNILTQVEELRDIASDFSIYSRIPRAELVPGDPVAMMEAMAEAYRDAARAEGVDIDLELPSPRPSDLTVRFDKKLLPRALRNLVENALRANAGRGNVRLVLELVEDGVRMRVSDSGPGVEPQHLQRIFEPYFSTHEGGTGLGLAITRRIVEEHGGIIHARNLEPGGLEVEISLPLGEPSE